MVDMELSLPLLSIILIVSFLIALYSIIYAFKAMDQKSKEQTNNKKAAKGKKRTKTKKKQK